MLIEQNILVKKAKDFIRKKYYYDLKPNEIIIDSVSENYTKDKSGNYSKFIIRLNVNKLLSDFNIRLDAETGEILSWCFPEYYKNAVESILTKEEALKIASEYVEIPVDAVLDEFFQESEENSHITNITWRHLVNKLEVENDSITIQINSNTKQVISITKIWNAVHEKADRITINDAAKIAKQEAPKYMKKKLYEIEILGQKYIPVISNDSNKKPYMKISKVWQVIIREPARKFPPATILSIDCVEGKVVHVEHSK